MSHLNIDVQYANLLGLRLDRFSVLSHRPYEATFRCAFCGDSKKDQTKRRGFLLEKGATVFYYCHNCSKSCSIGSAIKQLQPHLFSDYRLDILKAGGSRDYSTQYKPSEATKTLKELSSDPTPRFKRQIESFASVEIEGLKKLSSLPVGHPARVLVEKRKIPSNKHYLLFYTPAFKKYTNTVLPGKFDEKSLQKDSARLVIPFFDRNGKMFAFQGRSIDPTDKLRYITIVLDESIPRVYGLERVRFDAPIIVTEGPIDSLFAFNSIAQGGGDNDDIWKVADPESLVFLYDNEPRNPDTIARMEKALAKGAKLFIWDDNLKSKDLNELVQTGEATLQQISGIIEGNIYQGLSARARLGFWKRC